MADLILDAPEGVLLGMGLDTVSGDLRQIGVDGQPFTNPDAAGQQDTQFHFATARGASEFEINLELENVTNGRTNKSKKKMTSICKVSQQALFVIARYSTVSAPRVLLDAKLKQEAWDLLEFNPPKTDVLDRRFGNMWCGSFTPGGYIYGIIRIEAATEEGQEEIAGHWRTKLMTWNGHLEDSEEQVELSAEERQEHFVFATGGAPQFVTTIDGLLLEMTRFRDFVVLQGGGGVPLKATFNSYEELELPSDNVSWVEKQVFEAVMNELGKSYGVHLERKNDIEYILAHVGWYKPFDATRLGQDLVQINHNLNRIAAAADTCARGGACELPVDVVLPASELPERRDQRRPERPRPVMPPVITQ